MSEELEDAKVRRLRKLKELRQLEHRLRVCYEELGRLDSDVIRLQSGVAIGCTVETPRGRYVVTRTEFLGHNSSSVWLYGQKIRKDGTPSSCSVCIYGDWKVV